MARKPKKFERDGSNDWLATYADTITLILTFFILLYATSTVDQVKWDQVFYSFRGSPIELEYSPDGDIPDGVYILPEDDVLGQQPGSNDNSGDGDAGEGKYPFQMDDLHGYLDSYFKGSGYGDSVEVGYGKSYIYIRFDSQVFFGADSYELKNEAKEILQKLVKTIQLLEPYILNMEVAGHTANASSKYIGWDIAAMRATTVLKYFEYNDALPGEKMFATSYSHNRPIADNDTEEGRTKNRRVELIITRNDVNFHDPDTIQEILEKDYNIGTKISSDHANLGYETGDPSKYPKGSAGYFIETFKEKFGQNPIVEFNPNTQMAPMPIKIE